MRLRTVWIPLLLAVALAAPGCKKKDMPTRDEPAAEGETTDVTSDRSMQVMNFYVDFFNELLRDVPSGLRNYWSRTKDDGLDVDTMTKWGNVVCAGTGWMKMKREGAKKQLDKATKSSSGEFANMPPLAQAMYAAGVAYADQRDAVCGYVKGGEFKNDKGAKAKTLHTAVVAAREEWNKAVGALAAELDRIQDAQALAELAKYEADKSYGYWFRITTMRANEWLRIVRRDASKIEANTAALEETIAGVQEFNKAKGDAAHKSFQSYVKQVDRLAKDVAKLKKALASAKKPADKELVVDKQFDSLVSIYNTMISLHNTMIGVEGRGELK
jgi:hypothetical protein